MVVSSHKVIAIIGIAIAGAAWLMPEKSELMSRVIEDGDMSRALELMGDKPGDAEFRDLVTRFAESSSPRLFKEIKVLISLNDNLPHAFDTIVDKGSIFRTHQKREICSLFARRGLELNQLTPAVGAYKWLAESTTLKDKELEEAITISRYAGRPQSAIDLISGNLKQKGKHYRDLSDEKRSLLVNLHREVNQGVEALTCLLDELELAKKNPEKWEILDRVITVAIQADRVKKVLPVVDAHLQETDAASLSWQELLDRKQSHPSDEHFVKFGKMIAQNYEWNSEVKKAFPYYHKLAALGDDYSLERCFALYEWLQQREAMMALLAWLPLDRLNCDQVLNYAKLEASRADFGKAGELCTAALQYAEADKGEIYRMRGMMVLQQGKLSEALQDFETAGKLQPDNIALRDRIATIHASQGNHAEALAAYRDVPLENHSKTSFESYTLLADTLESEYDQLRIARHLLASGKAHESSGVYLEIAQIFQKYVYDREAFKSLDLGLEVFPDSQKLKLAKIDLLLGNEAYSSAFEEIKQSFDGNDPRYIQRVLSIANTVKDSAPMLELLDLEDPYAESWNEGLRLDLASLYEKMENFDKALTIWKSFDPENSNLNRLNARIAYNKHRFRDAVELQETYINTTGTENPYEWEFLGDAYLMSKRNAESQRAYTVAAQKFQSHFSNRL